jgi:hypothetical protein
MEHACSISSSVEITIHFLLSAFFTFQSSNKSDNKKGQRVMEKGKGERGRRWEERGK